MKFIKKILSTITICGLMVSLVPMNVNAASSSDDWDINKIPGAPSYISNQYDYLHVNYYSGGFIADCDTIYGSSNDRHLEISASGMSTKIVSATGKSSNFKTSYSSVITFTVEGISSGSCCSTGTIEIDD